MNPDDLILTVKKAEISGTLYLLNVIVVISVEDLMPRFGKIVKIVILNDIFFVMNTLYTDLYLNHVAADQISHTDDWICLKQSSHSYIPLWERSYKGMSVVSLKHTL